MELKKLRGETIKQISKQPALYLGILIIGSAGCDSLGRDTQVQPLPTQPVANLQNNANFVTEVVQEVGSAVVRINATRTVEVPAASNPLIERFFGEELFPPEQRVQQGIGSGFIISQDGHILTNAHVVEDADEVSVVLRDGRRFAGKVLGADPVTDVAVIDVEGANLPVVELADSDNIVVGQWAIAIGNPLGLNNTVTQGIISAIGRSGSDIGVNDKRLDFLQTDTAINPGNSGGPLLNAQGEVVGVNTAIIGGAQGLGFAIPVNTAQRIANQLITTGRVEHPYIGVRLIELTPEIQQEINQSNLGFKVEREQGVLIVEVAPNSPAARAGLRPGDIITQINGVEIQNADQVQDSVEATDLGKTLQITVNRNGLPQELTLQPEQLPTASR
ncbi:HhoA/HhoB/HtrA family serine endopeptidase [Gloeocapsopsis dulcis]|uniref:Serine protease n=1 Tax=Gloeocapsopsis dulcis AAB1 = 1H9 TaxID=1433147 RepID=A0A6N8G4L8_9CHRO|nr:HhoA/HhoB/HtrA family serine endopeptidase [Gloeocapsopsis dulcis]MUL39275.1 serine protease [Gloeocapsopsis dulcis AAB1 = 1H9]WNN89435.1 HhoA/HhoB/HtrA family serine endopeptidase [Gloeocapsopsis dulcis]